MGRAAIIGTGGAMADRVAKRRDDGRPAVHFQSARAGSAGQARGEPASGGTATVAAIYRRAAVASGFEEKVLPDGTVTLERTGRPDFAELDRCLRELADLGVKPGHTVGGAG
jgi:hypothetical protein